MANTLFNEKESTILDYTIDTRHKLIKALVNDGDTIPNQTSDKILLNSLLDGLDKAIHTKAKLTIEDKASQHQAEVTSMIGDLLNKINPNEYVLQNALNDNVQKGLPTDLKLTDIVDGEMNVGHDNVTYDGFYNNNKE